MKIAFFEIEKWEEDILSKELKGHTVEFFREPLTEKNCATYSDFEIISPFIYSSLNPTTLGKLSNLKMIATRSTGVDHIDLKRCEEKGILVSNVPSYGTDTVAEHTFALILAISRKIVASVERTKRGDFSLESLSGYNLSGKALGIVGLGKIGKRVAEIALAFKMKILVSTDQPDNDFIQKNNLTLCGLKELLSGSDIVTLHLPLTTNTRHLLNKESIKWVKRGAVLINTARGPIVETEALVSALETGVLSYAGLDVLEEEFALKEERELLSEGFLNKFDLRAQLLNHVILNKENVIVTPHNAFNSQESLREILKITRENILGFIEGRPNNIVH